MAISTLDAYIGSNKQILYQKKTASITTVANIPFGCIAVAGNPGAGTLAGTSTTTGVVPTDATGGMPTITFTSGTGYISRLSAFNTVASTLYLYDCLWKGGAYAFNASVSAQTSTSYSTRIPGGDYSGTELWIECVAQFTGNQSVSVQYLDQGGSAGDTGVIATGVAPIVERCFKMPLATGDTGVSGITGTVSSIATVGTYNILVLRPLAQVRIPVAGYSEQRDLYGTGMPIVYSDSALTLMVRTDSTALGNPEFEIEICNG